MYFTLDYTPIPMTAVFRSVFSERDNVQDDFCSEELRLLAHISSLSSSHPRKVMIRPQSSLSA